MEKYESAGKRESVHEIKVGSVVLEIVKKTDPKTGQVYFDYRTSREFFSSNDEVVRGPYCQQRDLRDNIIACVRCMEWISKQHRALRSANKNNFSE